MIYEEALVSLRRTVAAAFEAGTSVFPHYTLHGAAHLEELDRLALLLGEVIPAFQLQKERLNLLRLALILHDFAMVDVPDKNREAELRLRHGMDESTSFADVVRKTHQDEIERVFAQDFWIDRLTGLIPSAGPHILEDACTIARHHRFHPLDKAPDHLRDLCALVRMVDELDIGPRRAPLPAYEARRSQMDDPETGPASRFHWLKHICTRAVDRDSTLTVETRNNQRVLKVFVGVKATERTWKVLEERVVSKLRDCAEKEGVNQILKAMLQVEFEIVPGGDVLSGATRFLSPLVREDLNALPDELLRPKPKPLPVTAPVSVEPVTSAAPPVSRAPITSSSFSTREFKIVAIPPERLAEVLCQSGRLTVIGNTYIKPDEVTVGGASGAPSRIYVGPADSGKTRASLEWVEKLTRDEVNRWTVLRTDIGTLPESTESIVLDTSFYEDRGFQPPQKAILFLDDLPIHLPPPGGVFTATDAARGLFRWLQDLPYFREKRLVGTIRVEDVHVRPDWPDVLPSLGQELELIRLGTLNSEEYRRLWQGMTSGSVTGSAIQGLKEFSLDIQTGFLDAVVSREANPEAVATFIQQNVLKKKAVLQSTDAEGFSESAVEIWLKETWPALRDADAYGMAAKVFLALARFLEAGLRPESGFLTSLLPLWQYHQIFGPELCRLRGGAAEAYLPALKLLLDDGHASGEREKWIRPKLDFLLHAPELPEAEIDLPEFDWFAERAPQLGAKLREVLAAHLATAGAWQEASLPLDSHWKLGGAQGLSFRADSATGPQERKELLGNAISVLRAAAEINSQSGEIWSLLGLKLGEFSDLELVPGIKQNLLAEAISSLRAAVSITPDTFQAWYNLGYALKQLADIEDDLERRRQLLQEASDAYIKAIDANPNDSQTRNNLGLLFEQRADAEDDPERQRQFRDQAIDAYRKAIDADPKNSQAWNNLGVSLGQRAAAEDNPERQRQLRDQEIDAYRKATDADPKNSQVWTNLGVSLGQRADAEDDPERQRQLRDQAIDAYRKATDADPKNSKAWAGLGFRLGQRADAEDDPERQRQFRDQAIDAYRKAIDADPKNSKAWTNLGIRLGQRADAEDDPERQRQIRDQEVDAYRKATDADPKNSKAWTNLGVSLGQRADAEDDPERRRQLRDQEIDAYRKATDADPKNSKAWTNLGVRLGQRADAEDDPERQRQFRDEEIDAYRKATDADPKNSQAWTGLGVRLGQRADAEDDPERQRQLRDQEIDAYRKATDADPKNAQAWTNLGVRLGQRADAEDDSERQRQLRDEEIDAYRKATDADPKNAQAWNNLGVRLGQRADAEDDPERQRQLRDQAIDAYRKATDADPKNSQAWTNLGFRLGQRADAEDDPERQQQIRQEEIDAHRKATDADPNDAAAWNNLATSLLTHSYEAPHLLPESLVAARQAASLGAGYYNLACALARTGETDEALRELEGCLARGEISREHVEQDPDWADLRTSPRFREILEKQP